MGHPFGLCSLRYKFGIGLPGYRFGIWFWDISSGFCFGMWFSGIGFGFEFCKAF